MKDDDEGGRTKEEGKLENLVDPTTGELERTNREDLYRDTVLGKRSGEWGMTSEACETEKRDMRQGNDAGQ
jgi:hypothetical protein